MTQYENADELKSLVLGKTTDYASKYNPALLQGVPRSLNREDLQLDENNLPFFGEDIWYGYELSWLNSKGKPIVALAEFRFPVTSKHLIESKSFKLYLNSFNQSKFASWQDVEDALTEDLSKVAGAPATVTLFEVDNCPILGIADINAHKIDDLDIEVNNYQFDRTLLKGCVDESQSVIEEHLVSHLLKSNCLITNQPDWGSVYIKYRGKPIDHKTLLKYLISFREHNEFHEQCVERLYTDIMEFCGCESLSVFARYTRRGGLDINPFRSSEALQTPRNRTLRQ